jgi:hypothetical protein
VANYYINGTECKSCVSPCKTCTGALSTECSTCVNEYYLDGTECKNCITPCKNCTGPLSTNC